MSANVLRLDDIKGLLLGYRSLFDSAYTPTEHCETQ
jgi:hypothetical protein